ncbi:hypothetical protein [uncultured Methanoregula sp.]|uniref:hypothetical protein n=1 Tax=uncultured Methanoregula sp. TaxID=1005933 RepID=UPI002AAB2A5A|nr:hypothetical protein [uncultured Methanoregula sp.]
MAENSGQQNVLASVAFRSIAQFYDGDDPSPEENRQLSDSAEDRIFRTVLDVPKGYHGHAFDRLELLVPASDLSPGRADAIIAATRAHFKGRAPDFERDRRLTWRAGLREFRLTTAVCIPCFAGIAICSQFKGNAINEVVEQVLVIFCWVTIWQPFQSLVFDRWTQAVTARVYRHIAAMEISVRAA